MHSCDHQRCGLFRWGIVSLVTLASVLASQAHNEYVLAEKRREEWELKNHREGEILEMVEIFEVRKVEEQDKLFDAMIFQPFNCGL